MQQHSYLHPGEPADDARTRFLTPADTELHERWLKAAADRAPKSLDLAKLVVRLFRGQESQFVAVIDLEACVACEAFDLRLALQRLFAAGIIAGFHPTGSAKRFQLCLF